MVVTTRSFAKKTQPAAATAKPASAAKPKPKLPEQKAKRTAAPRRPRPLVALARRSDGRPMSFIERLSERRHAQFKHAGPVCHSCRISASQLAAATGVAGR
jgi:hypothetical protein